MSNAHESGHLRPPTAIVLAAGASRRMGARNKLLLPFRGAPLVARVVRAAQAASGDIVVVTGHEAGRVEDALRDALPGGAVRFARNADYASGMASSLRRGVEAAPAGGCGYLVCLGDQPRVTARALSLLGERFRQAGDAYVIVTFAATPGPPVLFGRGHRDALLGLPDGDHGAHPLLRQRADDVIRVSLGEAGLSPEALSGDIDTPEAYRRLAKGRRSVDD